MMFPRHSFLFVLAKQSVQSFIFQRSFDASKHVYLTSSKACCSWNVCTHRVVSSIFYSGRADKEDHQCTQIVKPVEDSLIANDSDGLKDSLVKDKNIGTIVDELVEVTSNVETQHVRIEENVNLESFSMDYKKQNDLHEITDNDTMGHATKELIELKEDHAELAMDVLKKDIGEELVGDEFTTVVDESIGNPKDIIGNGSNEKLFQENMKIATEDKEVSNSTNSKSDYIISEPSHIAYVVNLSFDTTNQQLAEMFTDVGTVKKVYIPLDRDTKRGRGFGFVTLSTMEEMYKAIDIVNDFFSQYGFVRDIFIPVDHVTNHPRGFAFITMSSEDAQKAIESVDGVELMGRILQVNKSLPRGQKAPRRVKKQETKVYIGNIAFNADADNLHSLFEKFGDIHDMYLPIDQYTGRTRGFAFVTMDRENARNAIKSMDGYELDGRRLRVNEARPKGNYVAYGKNAEKDDENADVNPIPSTLLS